MRMNIRAAFFALEKYGIERGMDEKEKIGYNTYRKVKRSGRDTSAVSFLYSEQALADGITCFRRNENADYSDLCGKDQGEVFLRRSGGI